MPQASETELKVEALLLQFCSSLSVCNKLVAYKFFLLLVYTYKKISAIAMLCIFVCVCVCAHVHMFT